ncbi:MAG: isoamylase early set domain-containing protein [Chloroflexota bacterium]|nr:isoamylase early set domain-containing protein [Chloroflexota bacterium]
MIDKQFVETRQGLVARVIFTLPSSLCATEVHLVGDFNEWNRSSHPLQQRQGGDWQITIDLAVGRAYQFRYLLEGREWLNDGEADAYVYKRYHSGNFVVMTDPHFKPRQDKPD